MEGMESLEERSSDGRDVGKLGRVTEERKQSLDTLRGEPKVGRWVLREGRRGL